MQIRSVDDVLTFAIKKEAEAQQYYEKLARWVERPDVAHVLEAFAADELRHRIRLEAVKAGEIAVEKEEIGSLGIADALNRPEPDVRMTYEQALEIAMFREKKSYALYTKLAGAARTQELREAFLKLAQEEAGHKLRLEIEYDWITS